MAACFCVLVVWVLISCSMHLMLIWILSFFLKKFFECIHEFFGEKHEELLFVSTLSDWGGRNR